MLKTLLVVLHQAGATVKEKRDGKKGEQGQGERPLVDSQHDAALPDRPGRVRLVTRLPWIAVDVFGPAFRVLRFRSALLEKKRAQPHKRAHLQELTLPILEHCLAKVTATKVLTQTFWR